MIAIIHGYLLDGSGSNLWTRSICQALARAGETIHLICQEPHPEAFDFISEAYRYHTDGSVETIFRREVPYAGRCIMHKPQIGQTLPVYVWDHYEEFTNVVPMVELGDDAINYYLDRNTEVMMKVVSEHPVSVMHVNHAVLMSEVARRVSLATSIPYAVMPHGSAIEYAVKKDERFLRLAVEAFTAASRVFVVGREMRERVNTVLGAVPGVDAKMVELNLGVDTSQFLPIPRESRRESISTLLELTAGLPRGKTAEMSQAMIEQLSGEMALDEMREAIASAATYTAKHPDADLEAKLAAIDWANEKFILFVGRLISSKGLQSIIAALPLIVDKHTDARLIAVGHGPLREALEAYIWALRNGERSLVENIVEWGSALEDADAKPKALASLHSFYDRLESRGELDDYFDKARLLGEDKVIFTGYLTHRELRYLFPCCDIAIFPSIVAEAGPLVFLEALASGCFPLGTYFAGMGASIDSVAACIPSEAAELMKLAADESKTVTGIVNKVSAALSLGDGHKAALRDIAVQKYDWKSVAKKLFSELQSLAR
jgi:glycosyltransferase involved in cell wall biosynthesis